MKKRFEIILTFYAVLSYVLLVALIIYAVPDGQKANRLCGLMTIVHMLVLKICLIYIYKKPIK